MQHWEPLPPNPSKSSVRFACSLGNACQARALSTCARFSSQPFLFGLCPSVNSQRHAFGAFDGVLRGHLTQTNRDHSFMSEKMWTAHDIHAGHSEECSPFSSLRRRSRVLPSLVSSEGGSSNGTFCTAPTILLESTKNYAGRILKRGAETSGSSWQKDLGTRRRDLVERFHEGPHNSVPWNWKICFMMVGKTPPLNAAHGQAVR